MKSDNEVDNWAEESYEGIMKVWEERLKEYRHIITVFSSILIYEREVSDDATEKLLDLLEEHGFISANDDHVRAMRSPPEN